jgi:glucan phosphoethanolaminetransferase (alkaline phosphatase superfamily)
MKNLGYTAGSILKKLGNWLNRNQTGIALLPLMGLGLSILGEKLVLSLFTPAIRLRFFAFASTDPEMARKLSFWEGMSLVRADMLLSFLIIPLIFCLLTCWLAPRWRIVIAAVFAALVQVIVILEMYCYLLFQAANSLQMGWFVIRWFLKTHQLASAVKRVHHILPAAAAANLLFIVLAAALALIAAKRRWQWLNEATLVAFGAVAALGAIAYLPSVTTTAWSQPLLKLFVVPAFAPSYESYRPDGRSVAELIHDYREAAHSPAPRDTAFTGAAKNYNVVFFVMESLSADAFDPARESLDDMPNVKEIRNSSFVMPRHYTSYPLTNNVLFSMFTSLYLVRGGGGTVADHVMELPGMIRTLGNRGYATAFYGYVWHGETADDLLLLRDIGFQEVVMPPTGDIASLKTFTGELDYVEKYDHTALLSIKADIRNWAAHGQRFAAGFFPEIAHDPYRALSPGNRKPILERGHDLAVYQDAWLGELLDELKRDGVLDHTIIVFTSDHGLRFNDPPGKDSPRSYVFDSFSTLNDTMLRVPMLIDVPGVLKQPVYVDTLTSHIDVTPTVLDLLGISADREREEGLPVYDPEIADRRLFLQMQLWGASGFYFGGNYYSRSAIGSVYQSSTLHFSANDLVPYDSAEARSVRNIVAAQEQNQNTLAHRLLDSH